MLATRRHVARTCPEGLVATSTRELYALRCRWAGHSISLSIDDSMLIELHFESMTPGEVRAASEIVVAPLLRPLGREGMRQLLSTLPSLHEGEKADTQTYWYPPHVLGFVMQDAYSERAGEITVDWQVDMDQPDLLEYGVPGEKP